MKVCILADRISFALQTYQKLSLLSGCECNIWLCNSAREGFFIYCAKQFFHLLFRTNPAHWSKLVYLLITARLNVVFDGLTAPRVLKKIRKEQYDIAVHGVASIFTRDIINCFARGILNAHVGGLLPRYRGRCAMEWALYEGSPVGVTVFYVDEGIDTGREIVIQEVVSVRHCNSIRQAKAYLFSLMPAFYAKAVGAEINGSEHMLNDGSGPRFYVMSRKLTKEIERKYFGGQT
jgi:hypothetical protein